MSDFSMSPPPSNNLQFDVVDAGQTSSANGSTPACAICREPIPSTYFVVQSGMVCPRCRGYIGRPATGSPVGRFFLASLFGLGTGLVGTVLWYAVRTMTNRELGFVAMLVGFMVGKAVLKGSGGWGGGGYRVLAVLITYFCIAATFVPLVFGAVKEKADKARQAKLAAPRDANAKDKNKAGAAHKDRGTTTTPTIRGTLKYRQPRSDSLP